MRKIVALCAALALLVAVPVSVAHKGKDKGNHHAHVFKANMSPVVYGADQAYSMMFGKAHLVDNKRNDKVTISMKGLNPGTTYPWHVHVIPNAPAGTNPCAAGAPQGAIVTAFKYKPLTANKSGNASAKGSGKTFRANLTDLYYVNVHDPATGAPISCGVLKPTKKTKAALKKAAKKKSAGKGKGKGHTKNTHKGHTDPA